MNFSDNITSALIAFCGIIIGTAITSMMSFVSIKKETKLRIIAKIFDKRIQAYENILSLVKSIRTVVPIERTDEGGNLIGYPRSLNSVEEFVEFSNYLFVTINENTHWLNIELVRELSFLQDYFTNLRLTIKKIDEEKVIDLGLIIKQDFIDFALNIENLAFDFFRKDIYDMKINKNTKWHKYKKSETRRRLERTLLFSKKNEIYNNINQ